MKEIMVVTGGAGFIGSHLSQKLLNLGYIVRIIDNLCQGNPEYIPDGAEFYEGNVLDKDLLKKVFTGAKGVFHMAAMSKVAPSIEKIEYCTEQNVLGTLNVLLMARECKVQKVVYSASSSYYGNRQAPQNEEMLPDPLNPYALSKYVGEQYCELYTVLYGLPTISLRYFNVYGRRQPSEGAYALVLGIFLKNLKEGKPLLIHGKGEQRRDFIHVSDIVEANIAAFKSEAKGMVLNVGSGKNISIQELADLISKDQIYEPRRAGDAEITLADISKTKAILNWVPKVSIEEGIQQMIDDTRNGYL
ncbi:NAD-dependent epimerase/dehydratase family protein [Lachnotalea glycerini]|uniref:NAD-dependent epimerase/dehydratase family protein n=1 Tax=Lachnotalea glycerini TaxID=1763509 RepID=A0A371JJK3_9FIRM|nr:NAD-dependent epimerase/dehydratase family protein [Lachnotalea glycerini]RDY32912.1 NAD-dependent epimerase/dehydratase family protein [Lachnotalea glycerini]